MKTRLLILIAIPAFLYSISTRSQEKLWEVDLQDILYEVSWIKQSNNGLIIASGAKGLMALDNNTGETIWHNKELKNVDKNSFQNIEGLPLFIFDYAPLLGKIRSVIMNAANGEVVYDTKEGNFKIRTYHLLIDQSCILFELSNPEDRSLMKFSLRTWEEEWSASFGKPKGLIGKLLGKGFRFINFGPMFGPNNELIVGLAKQIFAFDFESGKQLWKYETDKNMKALVYSDINNSLYVGIWRSKNLIVLDPVKGNDITPGKLKLKGTLLDIRDDGRGNLVLVETEGFNLIKPETGDLIWKKSYKIDYLDEVIPYENGYIALGKDEKKGSISLVDNNGGKVWDSKVKGYSYYNTPTKKGVLYISTERSNILDYNTGKDVWDRDVKFRSIPAVTYDPNEKKVILFENKKGYKFDLETGEIELFAEGIECENVTKKTPLVAEFVSTGYFISADQHASVISPEGQLVYSTYFKPVTTIGGLASVATIGLAFAGVDFDVGGAIENLNMLKSISHGVITESQDQTDASSETSVMAGLYVGNEGNMAPVFEVTKTRYFNSKNTRDHKFILAKREINETEGRNFIYMLNKASGEIVKRIELFDKTPNYIVDEIDNRVFLNEKNRLISGLQL